MLPSGNDPEKVPGEYVSDTRMRGRYGLPGRSRVSDTLENAIAVAGCQTPAKRPSKLQALSYGCQTPALVGQCLTPVRDIATACRAGARVSDIHRRCQCRRQCQTPGKRRSKMKAIPYGCQTPDLPAQVSDTRMRHGCGLQRWSRVSDSHRRCQYRRRRQTPGKRPSKLKAIPYGCQTPALASQCQTPFPSDTYSSAGAWRAS